MSKELLPCPFCGGTYIGRYVDNRAYYVIYCIQCNASVSTKNEEETVRAWNQRVPSHNVLRICGGTEVFISKRRLYNNSK